MGFDDRSDGLWRRQRNPGKRAVGKAGLPLHPLSHARTRRPHEVIEWIRASRDAGYAPFYEAPERRGESEWEHASVRFGAVGPAGGWRADESIDERPADPRPAAGGARLRSRRTKRVPQRVLLEPCLDGVLVDVAEEDAGVTCALDGKRAESSAEQGTVAAAGAVEPADVRVLDATHRVRQTPVEAPYEQMEVRRQYREGVDLDLPSTHGPGHEREEHADVAPDSNAVRRAIARFMTWCRQPGRSRRGRRGN